MVSEPGNAPSSARNPEREVFLARIGILLVIAAWAFIAWRRSARIIIDYGRELYCAWRLSEGDLLYRDVWYYYGPLGASLNSLLFTVFGPGYDRLLTFNLVLIAACALGLFELFRRAAGIWQGAVAAAGFVNLFAFGYDYMAQNNNFLSPYSHEATYGTYLTIGLIAALWRAHATGKALWLAPAGSLAAANLFTKPENLLASAAVAAVGLWLVLAPLWGNGRRFWGGCLAFAIPALVTAAVPTVWSAVLHGGGEGALLAHSSWLSVFLHPGITGSKSNLTFIGLANPGKAIDRLITSSAVFLAVCAAVGAFAWTGRIPGRRLRMAVVAGGGAVLGALLIWRLPDHPGGFLPFTSALVLWFRWRAYRAAQQAGLGSSGEAALLLWSVFGLAMLVKMALFPRITHYGFFLGMPAMIDLGLFLTREVPAWVAKRGGDPRAAAVSFALLCSGFMARGMALTVMIYGVINYPVGTGRDKMLAYDPDWHPAGVVIEKARQHLAAHNVRTLIVLPEGPVLNYLLRARAGFRGFVFNPGEIAAYGIERLLRELAENPPERVMILTRGLEEFGFTAFGSEEGSGKKILEWVLANYEVDRRFGGDPLNPDQFGATIYKRAGRETAEPGAWPD